MSTLMVKVWATARNADDGPISGNKAMTWEQRAAKERQEHRKQAKTPFRTTEYNKLMGMCEARVKQPETSLAKVRSAVEVVCAGDQNNDLRVPLRGASGVVGTCLGVRHIRS